VAADRAYVAPGMQSIFGMILAGAVAVAGTALAQTPGDAVSAVDRTAIATCLRDSAESPRACIGTIAVVCLSQAEGERHVAEIACSRREARVWRERLDNAARTLAQGLDSGARGRLVAVQRSWEGYASQKCAFAGELQIPARAATVQAACELREVALRSLELERSATRRPTNRPSRPEILR
jgi:hypothetical protein